MSMMGLLSSLSRTALSLFFGSLCSTSLLAGGDAGGGSPSPDGHVAVLSAAA